MNDITDIQLRNLEKLISHHFEQEITISSVKRIAGGYSNETYEVVTNTRDLILRKPPPGITIKSAHDMKREYRMLQMVNQTTVPVPEPFFYGDRESLFDTDFYMMEKVEGKVLRHENLHAINPEPKEFEDLSIKSVEKLATLHNIDFSTLEINGFSNPDGYVTRQIIGWMKRYQNAETEKLPDMENIGNWLKSNIPDSHRVSIVHNDYKYDNLILDQHVFSKINAVLDWEMATLGDPFMDLGTTLAYWVEKDDHPALRKFNTTWYPGNLSRSEVVDTYKKRYMHSVPDMLYYLVFGLYKIATIGQQIYKRYKAGKVKDPRYGSLIHVIKASADKGMFYINKGDI